MNGDNLYLPDGRSLNEADKESLIEEIINLYTLIYPLRNFTSLTHLDDSLKALNNYMAKGS